MKNFSDDRISYLFEACRLGTMRAASEYLDISTSSISRQIASLERDLGTSLIEKGRHTIQLTEAGRVVLEYYKSYVQEREALLSRINDLRGLRKGHLIIAAGQGLVQMPLVLALRGFLAKWPGIRVSVRSAPTRDVVEMVQGDQAHFGIILNPPDDPRVQSKAAIDQPNCLIVFPSHPLAGREQVSIRDLSDQKLLLPESGFRLRHILKQHERDDSFQLNTVVTASNIQVLIDCVLAEIGVTILPNSCVAHLLETGHLVSIPFVDAALRESQVHIIRRVGRKLPRGAVMLMDELERQIVREKADHRAG